MARLIKFIVSNYNEVVQNIKDPMIDNWPLMESPGPMLCIVGTYLIFVLKVGPKMMEKRPAFQLTTIIILYNAFQVIFNFWLSSKIQEFGIRNIFFFSDNDIIYNNKSAQTNKQRRLLQYSWWYFISKIIELLDTVFFVLRKKQNQVSFLHVYHHTTVIVFSWGYIKLLPNLSLAFILGFLNSIVHVFMYSYYLIAALGSKYRKYLWWKKYMTWIQLLQFVLMVCYLSLTLFLDCKTPKAVIYFFLTFILIFICLFSDFYRKTYKTKTV